MEIDPKMIIRKAAKPSKLFSVAVAALWIWATSLSAQKLGTIAFPTSANSKAQPFFLEGVKDLHSFAFDEATVAFQKAQALDSNFALAYWGEAMSYNHALWEEQDLSSARTVLGRLAPTAEARYAKAKSPKERAYLEAENLLFYGSDDKLVRDSAYSNAMAEMHARFPEDDEVTSFYALSLLGTIRRGDTGFRRQALAASLLLPIFQRNPDHPGAAHLIIHAFDDPDHAVLALPAARAYAKIAPNTAHALHMPSHIFVQLGLWEDARSSNIAAYKSAEDDIKRLGIPEGRGDFHALSWLQYSNLMLGNFDEANKDLEYARAALVRNPTSAGVQEGYLTMWARQVLETQQWPSLPLSPEELKPNGPWLFMAGYTAAHRKDFEEAMQAADELDKRREEALKSPISYEAKPLGVMQKELEAVIAFEQGRTDVAVSLAKEASDLELTMRAAPPGLPNPIKPSIELYAELLLKSGASEQAALAFQKELLRTPNRTPSVYGLKQTTLRALGL